MVWGFTSLNDEFSLDPLEASGKIPEWLSGILVRTGPAKFETAKRKLNHWFDGFAMLHAFEFKQGVVSYRNKFLRTHAFTAAARTGKIRYREFATDPCKSIFSKIQTLFASNLTDNANVNITKLAERYLALSETTLPIEFDKNTLDTVGVFRFHDGIRGQITTAHPHFDFARGQGFSYNTKFSLKSRYNVYRIQNGSRAFLSSIPSHQPSYMHSFGMTEHYLILAQFPFVVNPADLFLSGKPFIENYHWRPELGTKFLIIDKTSGTVKKIFESDPFFAFHHVNAFEKGNELFVDIVKYRDPSIIRALYLDALRNPTEHKIPESYLTRYACNLQTNLLREWQLSDGIIELPRINYEKFQMREYGCAYGVLSKHKGDFANGLTKINIRSGNFQIWEEPNTYPGEPVFIQSPNSAGEDQGILLSVVLDSNNSNSFLLLLDAGTFTEIGRATVPHHIPLGFHGNFYPRTSPA